MTELLGMLATTLVLVSFFQKGEGRIRVLNALGAACFVVYGLLIGAFSVWVMNTVLIVVHIYFLRKGISDGSLSIK